MAILFSDVFLLVLIPSLSLLFAFFFVTTRNREKQNLPPGPWRMPIIGNLHQLGSLPNRSLSRLAAQHGPLMFLRLGSIPTLVISSSQVVEEITKVHDITFSSRPVLYAAKKYSYGFRDVAFAPYGEPWRQLRKVSMVELLNAKRVQSFTNVREEEVALMVASISRLSSSKQPINLSKMLLKLANNVTCRIAFGDKYGGDDDYASVGSKFNEILAEMQNLLGGFCFVDFFPRLEWTAKITGLEAKLEKNFWELDAFYDQVINEHLTTVQEPRSHEREDFVDVLLRLRANPDYEDTFGNMDYIKGLLMNMFVAGTDTSSATLVWTMTELIRNPKVMVKIQQEIRNVMRNNTSPIVQEHQLKDLHYMKLVIKETMRLHTIVPLLVPRETLENCTINGYDIPAKSWVFINAEAIAMDPNVWEDPEKFWPERFHGNNLYFAGQDFSMIPFGFGRRSCPGANFAMVFVELALANLLCNFNWELPSGLKAEDINMEQAFGVTMHKKQPLCLVATTD